MIKSNNGNVNQSFVSFLAKFNSILDLYAPLKKISKQKLKFRNKPWITLGLQKSISIKNRLLTKYIKLKDVTLKNEAQIKYKQYRNLLSTLMKERCLTELQGTANTFNKYFVNVATDIQSSIRYSKNNFHDFQVTPVYKKDSKLKCSNYRPLSLQSNIDKALERFMYNWLYNFLELNNVIYDLQFGFRQKYLTSHALIHLTDKIREQLDSGNFACGIFVDLQKAFDTVDHDILIQQFSHYDIRGVANNWFSSYLQNLSQYVIINGFSSKSEHIRCGVGQGSILGALLFLSYINVVNCAIKYCSVH